MTLSSLRSWFYRAGRILGDVQAVQKHRVVRRVKNRLAGRAFSRILRRLR